MAKKKRRKADSSSASPEHGGLMEGWSKKPKLPTKEEILADLERIIVLSQLEEASGKDDIVEESKEELRYWPTATIKEFIHNLKLLRKFSVPAGVQFAGEFVGEIANISQFINHVYILSRASLQNRQRNTFDLGSYHKDLLNHPYFLKHVFKHKGERGEYSRLVASCDEQLAGEIDKILKSLGRRASKALDLVKNRNLKPGELLPEDIDYSIYKMVNEIVDSAVEEGIGAILPYWTGSNKEIAQLKDSLHTIREEQRIAKLDHVKALIASPALSVFAVSSYERLFGDGNDYSLVSYAVAIPLVSAVAYFGIRGIRWTYRKLFWPSRLRLIKESNDRINSYS